MKQSIDRLCPECGKKLREPHQDIHDECYESLVESTTADEFNGTIYEEKEDSEIKDS